MKGYDEGETRVIKAPKVNLRWMNEYTRGHLPGPEPVDEGQIYVRLPYINIDLLISMAEREGRGLSYVLYGAEVHLKQQLNWLSRLYYGKGTIFSPEDGERFDSIMRSIEIYIDFISWVGNNGYGYILE